ncbi:MAG TPA: HTH domain-containing protein, partial [Desulfohalobiaceae bacterium]|nr:HTH domain-containing protein [Desulfohalobiaceae bacterium]
MSIKKFNLHERIIWLHNEIKNNSHPNSKDLAEKFELSERTAQRTISYLRDRMQAPLEYSRRKGGYYYLEGSFDLPLAKVSQEEILAILLARNLLSGSAEGFISGQIQRFSRKLISQTAHLGLTEDKITKSFSAAWNGYSPAQARVFQLATLALLESRALSFAYASPVNERSNQRTVRP